MVRPVQQYPVDDFASYGSHVAPVLVSRLTSRAYEEERPRAHSALTQARLMYMPSTARFIDVDATDGAPSEQVSDHDGVSAADKAAISSGEPIGRAGERTAPPATRTKHCVPGPNERAWDSHGSHTASYYKLRDGEWLVALDGMNCPCSEPEPWTPCRKEEVGPGDMAAMVRVTPAMRKKMRQRAMKGPGA